MARWPYICPILAGGLHPKSSAKIVYDQQVEDRSKSLNRLCTEWYIHFLAILPQAALYRRCGHACLPLARGEGVASDLEVLERDASDPPIAYQSA